MIDIKYWRLKRNLKRVELASLVGTTRGYIYEIETNKKIPSVKMFYRIAEVLEIGIFIKDLHECEEFIESEVGDLLEWRPTNK